ncbi:MAG: nucleolar protein 14 [Olpidium bornovanus]|uniref:Nucleolar protein 14 n=1 Tax=Olpidium bornovanus TaxID=278681 RepID=A0A8H8DJ51_9FUNG|nr:MAG: nucleolar protein 14 [Olpidium bornovanus]
MFRFLAGVFSTSDLVHPVATPATLLLAECLAQLPVRSVVDLAKGLFYQALSKRYVPEVLSFLAAALQLLKPKSTSSAAPATLFATGLLQQGSQNLHARLRADVSPVGLPNLSVLLRREPDGAGDDVRWQLIGAAAKLCGKFGEANKGLHAFCEAFSPLGDVVRSVAAGGDVEGVPSDVQVREHIGAVGLWFRNSPTAAVAGAADLIARLSKHSVEARRPLSLQQHRPLAIPTYFPKFEDAYNPDRHYDPDGERQELARLRARHRREKKGAARELRRDAQFISAHRLRQQRERDEQYRKKIRAIEGSLGDEEGRFKKMDKARERAGKRKR